MSVHKLMLVWKREVDGVREDVELGTCFHTDRPTAGELISYAGEQGRELGVVWRVVEVYHQPFMPDSMTWRNWRERGVEPVAATHYWVEPAEGPWEP